MKKGKKIVGVLLTAAMLCTVIPKTVFAGVYTNPTPETEEAEPLQFDSREAEIKSKVPGFSKVKRKSSNEESVSERSALNLLKPDSKRTEEGRAVKNAKAGSPKESSEKRGEGTGSDEIDRTGICAWEDLDLTQIEDDLQEDTLYGARIMKGMEPYLVYRFVPETSGRYAFISEGAYDTYGMIGDEDGILLSENDDRDLYEEDYNFAVSAYLQAGNTYYCVAQMLRSNQTGFFHCFISSWAGNGLIDPEDVQKLEIISFPREHFYKSENHITDMPFEDCEYRLTLSGGLEVDGYMSSGILGLSAGVRFKYPSADDEDMVDLTREDNALIYSIAETDAAEIPITFEDSPIESLEIVTSPNITALAQYYADGFLENMEDLSVRVHYTDGTENMMYWTDGSFYMDRDDEIDSFPTLSWKTIDDELETAQVGSNAVVVSYLDQSVEIPITIQDSSVKSIAIVRNPAKMYYGIYDTVIDLYGLALRIVYGDNTSEEAAVTMHGSSVSIGKYQLPLRGFFLEDEDENLTGEISVVCGYEQAFYTPAYQTYASLRKEAVPIRPRRAEKVSLNKNTVYRVYRFTPIERNQYSLYSNGAYDTYLEILDADGNFLAGNDDGGSNGNFRMDCILEGGLTYYFVVSMYETGETGSFAFVLDGESSSTISYNVNGGMNSPSNPTYYYNERIVLQNPVRAQHIFEGWYTDSACQYRITEIHAGMKQNFVLYAKWRKVNKPGKVKLSSVQNAKSKKIQVKFKKVKASAGYEIAYATNKKFKKAVFLTTNKTKATIAKLKKGKTYYVRVCAYNVDSTGQKIKGKWSSAKKIKIKK